MTNEELDQARAEEAFEQSRAGDLFTDIAAHAARLAREGWTPPVAVDPDAETALALLDEYNKEEIEGLDELVLEAIKRGRALAAEAKPGMRWIKFDYTPGKLHPVNSREFVCAKYQSGAFDADVGINIYWPNVTHYAIITQPEKK